MKDDPTIIQEALAARIRILEDALEDQRIKAEKTHGVHFGSELILSRYIRETVGKTVNFLDLEAFIEKKMLRSGEVNPDALQAYLVFFEILDSDGRLVANDTTGLNESDVGRIRENAEKYGQQLNRFSKMT